MAAEAANGENHGGASRDSTEDTFTITREYMLINGFEEDASLAAVEAQADSVEALA